MKTLLLCFTLLLCIAQPVFSQKTIVISNADISRKVEKSYRMGIRRAKKARKNAKVLVRKSRRQAKRNIESKRNRIRRNFDRDRKNIYLGNPTFSIPLADEILLEDYTPSEVMLLGSWHWAYYNLDSHKTAEADMVDYTTPERQKEIRVVVDRLKAFKPTIICVENSNQSRLDSLYQGYLNGTHALTVDEEQQLGFRVAKELGLKKIHAVNSTSWLRDNYDETPDHLLDFWKEEDYIDTLQMNFWGERYTKWYDLSDKFPKQYSVDQALMIDNHPLNIKRALGHYLVTMSTSNDSGADAFSLKWYDRNVRIFNNILRTKPQSTDRILVIYGTGHVPILEQLFDASPQFEIVRPYKY